MLVREAVDADAEAIAQVHVDARRVSHRGVIPASTLDALSVPRVTEWWRKILVARAHTRQCVLVAETDARLVGFANAGPRGSLGNEDDAGHPDYDAEILRLYVAPGSQRQGVGSALLRAVAEQLLRAGFRSVSLWCLADGPGVPFYVRIGGSVVARRQHSAGGKVLDELCFAWSDLDPLLAPSRGASRRRQALGVATPRMPLRQRDEPVGGQLRRAPPSSGVARADHTDRT